MIMMIIYIRQGNRVKQIDHTHTHTHTHIHTSKNSKMCHTYSDNRRTRYTVRIHLCARVCVSYLYL
jgi:hypothetical protein